MGRVPLHYAALFGDLARARSVLEGGADVHAVDRYGQSALHYAAQGCSTSVAELLLSYGALVDATDQFGNTPLWTAMVRTRGGGPVVDLLLARGADPEHVNVDGRTPAELARALKRPVGDAR